MRRGRKRGRCRRSLLAAEERNCWGLGFPSVRSWAWLVQCLHEEIGFDDLTRRKGTPRQARWWDLWVRGDLDTEWLLTGALPADGEIQQRKIPSFWSASRQGIMSMRCEGVKGRGQGQREKSGSSYLVGIDGFLRQGLRAPAEDFGKPGGSLVELEEGKRRGERGLFIGACTWQMGQVIAGLKRERGVTARGGNGHRRGIRSEEGDDWPVGPSVSEGRRKWRVPIWKSWGGPWAKTSAGPDGFPSPFPYFLFFSSFSFSVFLFLLYLLHLLFKLIQTSFWNLLMFQLTF
jgi:hypothetical protein